MVEITIGITSCGNPAGRFVQEMTLKREKSAAEGAVVVEESGIVEAMRII